jgi:8-amino-7-oxononanoate synthase
VPPFHEVFVQPSLPSAKLRNTPFVVRESTAQFARAIDQHLMQVTITGRDGKRVTMPDGRQVVEFLNCSYLGLDLDPGVIEASKSVDASWGMNFCCARSRFSIEPQQRLETELSRLYRGQVITFPSTTTTHMSVMPLVASGVLLNEHTTQRACLIFDRFAHSSMHYLKPVLAEEATVETIAHNSLGELRARVMEARARNEVPVYVADGIYSMGGLCPVAELLALAEELDFFVYIDDAHGTSIFGERGEGLVLSHVTGPLPDRLIVTFALSKGFGAYGGGVVVSGAWREHRIRCFGQIYAFSAALNFSAVHACLAALERHHDGTVQRLQQILRNRVALFDELWGTPLPFSPIRMVRIGNEQAALEAATAMLRRGFYVSVVFFPVVPRGGAQLRVCIAANHSRDDIRGLVAALKDVVAAAGVDGLSTSSVA